jgi:hypothetical protein
MHKELNARYGVVSRRCYICFVKPISHPMAKTNQNNTRKGLKQKFLEFQKKGLVQYGKYLDKQLFYASKKEIRKHYKKYIEEQLALNARKIKAIDAKLIT